MTRNDRTTALPNEVSAYLAELNVELRDFSASRRNEIVGDVEAHIIDALEREAGSASDVQEVLDLLGAPAEIARAARAELPDHKRQVAGRDIATIVLLLVGGFALGVGWIVGVILLWVSDTWRTRDKLLGTLLLPGGLAAAAALSLFSFSTVTPQCVLSSSGDGICPTETGLSQVVGAALPVVGTALLVIAIAGPIFTATWLTIKARRQASL